MTESATSVRPWTRPQDWAEVVLGVVTALAFLVFAADTAALWTMVILGALIAIDGLLSLAMPGLVYGEAVQIVLGVLLFVSPWVMGYTEFTGMSWTSWIVGVLTVIVGALGLQAAQATHRGVAGQH